MSTIALTRVLNSENVTGYGYDAASKTLAVQYSGGGLYHYFDVSPETAAAVAAARADPKVSFGKHINLHVKGKHAYKRQEKT